VDLEALRWRAPRAWEARRGPDRVVSREVSGVQVGDVMASELVVVQEGDPVHLAAAVLVAGRWSSAPVVDAQGLVVGVVGDEDLLGVVGARRDGRGPAHRWTVRDVMAPWTPVSPHDDLGLAVAVLTDRAVRCLPVLDDGGRLVGVVRRHDLLAVLGGQDPLARRGVLAALSTLCGDPPGSRWDVEVEDGVAVLRERPGARATRSEGELAAVLARTVPGVVGVVVVPAAGGPAPPGTRAPR